MQLRLDSGRTVTVSGREHRHLDYGYAVTSHSSQGLTADRVLVHVDTERTGEQLVNRRFAYVAVSRAREDAHIYTNDRTRVGDVLNRDVSHRAALATGPAASSRDAAESRTTTTRGEQTERTIGPATQSIGLSR